MISSFPISFRHKSLEVIYARGIVLARASLVILVVFFVRWNTYLKRQREKNEVIKTR